MEWTPATNNYSLEQQDCNMNAIVIKALTESACASIRYRTRKEILDENPDIKDYLDEILDDNRVKYVLTWQKPSGFLGNALHAGYIPMENRKYNTGGGGGGGGELRWHCASYLKWGYRKIIL